MDVEYIVKKHTIWFLFYAMFLGRKGLNGWLCPIRKTENHVSRYLKYEEYCYITLKSYHKLGDQHNKFYQITELVPNERYRLRNADFTAVLTQEGSKQARKALKFPLAGVQSYEGLGFFPSWVIKVSSSSNPEHNCVCMINYHELQPSELHISTTNTKCLLHIFDALRLNASHIKWRKEEETDPEEAK